MKTFQQLTASIAILLISACSGIAPLSDPQPVPDTITAAADKSTPAASAITLKPLSSNSLHELLVGEFALSRNQFEIAQTQYLKQARETLDLEVIKLAAKIASYNRDYEALEELALLWIELEPANSIPRGLALEALAAQGDGMGALEHASWLYSQNHRLDSLIAVTSIHSNRDDIQKLIAAFGKLQLDKAQQPAVLLALAILHQDHGNLIKAQQMVEEFLLVRPMNHRGILLLSQIYHQQELTTESLKLLAAALDKAPDNYRLRRQYARFMALVDRSKAIEQFELLRNQQPDNQNTNFMLAVLLMSEAEVERASMLLTEASSDPSLYTETQYYLGAIADEAGNIDLAIDYFGKVQSGQNYLMAASRRAALLAQHRSLASAQEYFYRLRAENPEHAIELFTLESTLLIKMNRGELAYKLLSDSLTEFPNNTKLLYARSMVAEQQDNYPQTERDLRKLLALDADNAIALNALGYSMLVHTAQYEEAYKLIKRAYLLNPGDPATMDSMGWVLFQMGQLEAALKHLQKAMEIMPDPEIAAHLGEVEWSMGNPDIAIQIWRQGLQQTPEHPIILETIKRLGVTADLDTPGQAL